MDQVLPDFKEALLQSNKLKVRQILDDSLTRRHLYDVFEDLIVPSMETIGDEWVNGDISLIQVYMSGRICEEIIDEKVGVIEASNIDHPKMAITILQDYHMLGKRIVCSIFKSCGLHLIDYGGGMTIDALLHKIKEDKIEILLISALMLNTALKVKDLRKRLDEENINIKILVGGAPFRLDKNLWKEVGADFMAVTAGDGLKIILNQFKEVERSE